MRGPSDLSGRPASDLAEPAAALKGRRRRWRNGDYASWWWAVPALVLVLLLHYVATAFGAVYAFTDYTGLGSFRWVGWANFVKIFSTPSLVGVIKTTLMFAFLYVILTNVLGLLFALALNRGLKTRYLLRVALFAPVVLSSLAVSYIFKFIYAQNGPLNTLLGMVGLESWQRTWLGDPQFAFLAILSVLVWQNVGMTMVMYLAGLATVPEELEEAAALDGAGIWRRFFNVVLPSIQPSVAIASALTLVGGLRVFDQIMAMTGGGPFGATDTLATVIYRETFAFARFGYGAALSLTLTVFVVLAAALQLYATRKRD